MLASAAQSSSDSNDGIRKLRALVDPDALALGSRAQLIDGRRYPSQDNLTAAVDVCQLYIYRHTARIIFSVRSYVPGSKYRLVTAGSTF